MEVGVRGINGKHVLLAAVLVNIFEHVLVTAQHQVMEDSIASMISSIPQRQNHAIHIHAQVSLD